MSFNNTLENEILDALLGSSHTLLGSNVDLALSTTPINEDGTGITEPIGAAYARVTVPNDGANWAPASAGSKMNTLTLSFPQASGGNWGLITHWALYDSGVMKMFGIIDDGTGTSTPRQVNDGDTFKFVAGGLRITLD
jgi:hypothetical protein